MDIFAYLENMMVALMMMVDLFLMNADLQYNWDYMEQMVDFAKVNYGNQVDAFDAASPRNYQVSFE